MTTGLNAVTGATLGGLDHLTQSLADLLTTPLGTRVMRRDYGCLVPDLIDQPANPVTRLAVLAAAADAIRRWEPRVILTRLQLVAADSAAAAAGQLRLTLDLQLRDTARPQADPAPISVTVPLGGITP